jgi:hypothetical protein
LAESTANAYRIENGAIVGNQKAPFTLGPIGGRIVAETFVGLLLSDSNSILNSSTTRQSPIPTTIKALFDSVQRGEVRDQPVRPQPSIRPRNPVAVKPIRYTRR